MNKVFVHCWIKKGGALEVLKNLIKEEKTDLKNGQFIIFSVFSDRDFLQIGELKIKIITALPKFLNNFFVNIGPKIPFLKFFFDYRNLLPFYPILVKILGRKLSKYKFEKIVVSSFAVSKNIKFDKKAKSVLYLHSPMQYIWENYENYIQNLNGIKKVFFKFFAKRLRKRDKKKTGFDVFYSNSNYTKKISQKIYGYKNIKVKYPKIDNSFLNANLSEYGEIKDYFVFVGRVSNLIRNVDKIINLFNQKKTNLLIIGDGPDLKFCKKIAGPTITFIPRINKSELVKIVGQSRGLINFCKESLGLGVIEALCLGVPIFGYNEGGNIELVSPEQGILFDAKNTKHLGDYFDKFLEKKFDRNIIRDKMIKLLSQNS